ncbi:3-deoxy-D-arabino-heptulosonate 7-phosphate synthase [Bordetella petrii]|uniref:3-deoxy-D-arabino-heptulosonate 7-phosphate synthase n=1 Tax=Bordetella petrii TaxID=94624 RepID=UPI00372EA428
MARPSSLICLDTLLRGVERRYRLPDLPSDSGGQSRGDTATELALAIERVRQEIARGAIPDAARQRQFVELLRQLIRDAMRANQGDPVFQAMVLRHAAPRVREYASLSAHAGQYRRAVHGAVNTFAHPAKQQRMPPGRLRAALARLHGAASAAAWTALADTARDTLAMPELAAEPAIAQGLERLLAEPALGRLRRLDALASDALARQYQSLWDRNSPRPGSDTAAMQGSASRRRGAAVEALAARALEAVARRLDGLDGAGRPYRVVTSMRVPAAIPGEAARAKTEWDAILLRRASTVAAEPVWDICLLVEAKASADAAGTDLPRLLRGLRLLAHAVPDGIYPFETRQGVVRLRGASLARLPDDAAGLAATVLYCCDAPVEAEPRLLSAASRMQLLSAPASLAFASGLAAGRQGDAAELEPVWADLLQSPRWRAVLNQYPALRQARELMVHPDDLMRAAAMFRTGAENESP